MLRFLFFILLVSISNIQLDGQPEYIKELENKVYTLNNELKYVESQNLIQQFIDKDAVTNEDKYYAYLFLSFTYKRLSDYQKNLQFLDKALSYGLQTPKKDYFFANIQCQKAFALFDIQRYVEADSIMQDLAASNYQFLDDEHKAKILMQEGYLLFLANQNNLAEQKYDAAITFLKRSSICDLPMIYAKKIELYGAMSDDASMQRVYNESLHYADSCGIIKYSIYTKEMLIKVLANKCGFGKVGSELDSLHNLFNRNIKLQELNDLNAKYELSLRDLALKNQKDTNLYLLAIIILLFIGLLFLTLVYFLLKKQKKLVSDQYHFTEQLISILSHDIKEPLMGVRLMLKKMVKHEGPYAQVSVSLENQITSVNNILENLLSLRKSNSDESIVKSSSVSLVVNKVIQVLKNDIEKKNITIVNKIKTDLILPIQEEKLQIVIYNLIQNALKYSFVGSAIEVYIEDNRVFIRDFGTGIAPEQLGKLMKDVTTSKHGTLKEQGCGLGLYLLGNLMQGEKIEILFHNNVEEGTLVSVG